MKVQLQEQTIRFRINEDELTQLLTGAQLHNTTRLPNGDALQQTITLMSEANARFDGTLALPRADVEAYCNRLPCRDGLEFSFPLDDGGVLQVAFEVDVRDSVRNRGIGKRG